MIDYTDGPYASWAIHDFIQEHEPPYTLFFPFGNNNAVAILDAHGNRVVSTEHGICEKDLEAIAVVLNIAAKKIEGEK